jgi:hypothetical protein
MSYSSMKTLSSKGNECIFVHNFKNCKSCVNENGNITWRYSILNCPATVATNSDCTSLLSLSNNHSRSAVVGSDQLQKARVGCNRKAADHIGSWPSKVMLCCLAEVD